MIDLHMHTIYSDGDKTVAEILKMCEDKKLEYISITDHNTCKQYYDKAFKENIFSGRIIIGTEQNAKFKDRSIEILGYNVNPDIINEWCEKYYTEERLREKQVMNYKELVDICNKHGLVFDESKIIKPKKVTSYIARTFFEELIRYSENHKILGELSESSATFYRKGLANPNSSFFMNPAQFYPTVEEVIDKIHEAGGKAFFAHPFDYKFEDTMEYLDDLIKSSNFDGIECFHPSSVDDNKKDNLVEYARKNNLYISGGSDYHGKLKPDIEIGIGRGNLNISKEIIENWI